VNLVFEVMGVAAGLAVGGVAGYRIGKHVRGCRRDYWALNAATVLGCAALNYYGLVSGRHWLACAAIGLMGGAITGMKYGYVDSIRVWENPVSTGVAPDSPADSSEDELAEQAEESISF
jgi:hypothetical protein